MVLEEMFIYYLSLLVKMAIVGVDMTDEQIEKAESFKDFHRDKFNYTNSNVQFKKGYIEYLDKLGLKNNYDVVVSNCVVNLSPDKEAVFKQVYNILKEGGEFYFSDVYSSQRIPKI